MTENAATEMAVEGVEANLNYAVDTGEKLVNQTMPAGDMSRVLTGTYEHHNMLIRNGRPDRDQFVLDVNGFEFVDHPTGVADFFDPEELASVYYPEIQKLVASGKPLMGICLAIRNPIQADPLTICDSRSVSTDDFLTAERRYPHRVGETYRMAFNPGHEWYYFPQMRRDEALVFKVFDSDTTISGRFTPHTSFTDPTSPPDAPARESIEMRALAFFDD